MTGRDLLDAIGAVDEELLEQCQEGQQITAKNKILWVWDDRKYVSIAACVCLLSICILGITYWQYNLSNVDGSLVNEEAQVMTALSDTHRPEAAERLPGTDEWDGADSVQGENISDETDSAPIENISNGTDGDLPEDSINETDQDSKASSIYGSPNDNYQPYTGSFPDTDTSSGTERVESTPKESESTENLISKDDKPPKDDETGNAPPANGIVNVLPNYSQGIKIEAVNEIPKENPPQAESPVPGATAKPKPAQVPSVKKILAENTVILRGTVKKIQHFHATGGKINVYFSVVSVKVKEAYRADGKGDPQKGKTCKVYLPDSTASIGSGDGILGQLAKGSEIVIMPNIADEKTGIRKKEKFFAFLDVSDYYLDAKTSESHVFLKRKSSVLYDTDIYDIPYNGKKVTLSDVGNYIRKMLKKMG